MAPKPKRNREWDADNRTQLPVPDWNTVYDTGGKVKAGNFNSMLEWMYQWMRDMSTWGQDMRDDLIRLEGQAGFPTGDPGDPPGGPPE
jgi:hypothetical protein